MNIIRKSVEKLTLSLLVSTNLQLETGIEWRGDWEQKVKEAADLIKLYTYDAQKCRKDLASNKGFLRVDGQKCVEM